MWGYRGWGGDEDGEAQKGGGHRVGGMDVGLGEEMEMGGWGGH